MSTLMMNLLPLEQQQFNLEIIALLDQNTSSGRRLHSFIKLSLKQFNLDKIYDVGDLVNETYFRAAKAINSKIIIKNPYIWLKSTAYNIIREFSRSQKTQLATESRLRWETVQCLEELNLISEKEEQSIFGFNINQKNHKKNVSLDLYNIIKIVQEYGHLAIQTTLSYSESERMTEILGLAYCDELLNSWINKIDCSIAEQMNLLSQENLADYDKQLTVFIEGFYQTMSTFDIGLLNTSYQITDTLKPTYPSDTYNFTLSNTQSLQLSLTNISNPVDWQLKNTQGTTLHRGASQFCTLAILKGTETLAIWLLLGMILQNWDIPLYSGSINPTNPEAINLYDLTAGEYSLEVSQTNGDTIYNLKIAPLSQMEVESGFFTVGQTGQEIFIKKEVFDNPLIDGAKRPLFSLATANPNDAFKVGQIADVTGDGKTFIMEELQARYNAVQSWDFNDNDSYPIPLSNKTFNAPLVSGTIALMLEANPNLTYRDIQHILVKTAQPTDVIKDAQGNIQTGNGWTKNQAGYWFNDKYGFGVVDVTKAVSMAASCTPVVIEDRIQLDVQGVNDDIPNGIGVLEPSIIKVDRDITVETVEVSLDTDHQNWADLKVVLTSPDGTQSVLAQPISGNVFTIQPQQVGFSINNWKFTSVRHWGESSQGEWKLQVFDEKDNEFQGAWNSWKLNIYGTKPTVFVSATDPNASESGDLGEFTITRTGNQKNDLIVNYSLGSNAISNAIKGVDYIASSGSAIIPAGQSKITIPITLIDDAEYEGDETVVVNLNFNIAYNVVTGGSAVVMSADNNLSNVIITATYSNAQEDGNAVQFVVTRSGNTGKPLTINYYVVGNAINEQDYTTLSTDPLTYNNWLLGSLNNVLYTLEGIGLSDDVKLAITEAANLEIYNPQALAQTREWVVLVTPGTSLTELANLLGAEDLGATRQIPNIYIWKITDHIYPQSVANMLRIFNGVEFAYPEVTVKIELLHQPQNILFSATIKKQGNLDIKDLFFNLNYVKLCNYLKIYKWHLQININTIANINIINILYESENKVSLTCKNEIISDRRLSYIREERFEQMLPKSSFMKHIKIVQEYCKLAAQLELSEPESERMAEILELAQSDDSLNFWINEAEYFLALELDLLDEENLADYDRQIAFFQEDLESLLSDCFSYNPTDNSQSLLNLSDLSNVQKSRKRIDTLLLLDTES